MSQLLTSLGAGAGALGSGLGKGVQAIGQGVGGGLAGLVHGLTGGGAHAAPVPGAPTGDAASAIAQAAADAGGAGASPGAAADGGPNFFRDMAARAAQAQGLDPSQGRQAMLNIADRMGAMPEFTRFPTGRPGARPLQRLINTYRRSQQAAPPPPGPMAAGIPLDPRIASDPALMQRDPETGMPLYLLRGIGRIGPQA
jgi:hypothetical protein